jgi:hypothetical protein
MEVIDVDAEEGVQLAVIPAAPEPANIVMQSGEDLIAAQPVAESTADLATPRPDSLIDNAIDELITRFAAFCLNQLEKSVTLSDGVDLNADADALENKLEVRVCILRRT